jgi:hypothetical protein
MTHWLLRWLAAATPGPGPQIVRPRPQHVVAAPPRFAWDEKRWQHHREGESEIVSGKYRVFDRRSRVWRAFDGRVEQRGSRISAYIADPPVEIRRHRHGACLQLVQAPWFHLHWNRQPKNIDDALLYMERILDESFNAQSM